MCRVAVLQVKESRVIGCASTLFFNSLQLELKSYQSPLFFNTGKTAFILQNLKMLIIPSFHFFLNSVETAGTAEANTCSRCGPHSHYSQQHCNYCLNTTESCGGPFSRPSPHWNQSSTYYKSGFSSYSNIPTEQEFPSDFCYLG